PPEAQADLAARAHDAARFTQGGETVPPHAPKARGHVEAVIGERQMEHITDSDVGRGGAGRGDGCQPFRGIERPVTTAPRSHAKRTASPPPQAIWRCRVPRPTPVWSSKYRYSRQCIFSNR